MATLPTLSAHLAYRAQSRRAAQRGIEWKFDFDSWWRVWDDSGKWEQRGRGAERFCMARLGDVGPYSPDNVEIVTNRDNFRQAALKDPERCRRNLHLAHVATTGKGRGWTFVKKNKTNPYQVMVGRRYVGMYATQQEAEAAYAVAAIAHLDSMGEVL